MLKSTFYLINSLGKKIKEDHVTAFSAQAAFFIIISFFPFIMLLFSIVRYIPIQESTVLKFFIQAFPTAINSMIVTVITEIYDSYFSGTIVYITALSTLWSVGKSFLAVMKGLNEIYGIKESRRYILLRVISASYTLVFAIMVILTMILFVFGNRLFFWIEQRVPGLKDTALVIISLRTIVGLLTLILFFLLIYVVIPNRKTKIINELPGAMVCAAGWMGFSYAFSYYIDNFSNYISIYGSLTAIVLFMLWMYFCMYLLFIGAEINLFFEDKSIIKHLKQFYRETSGKTYHS